MEHKMNEKKSQLKIGIALILTSAFMTCSGQLCWKLGAIHVEYTLVFYLIGFALYGLGALLMMLAFRFGEMSVLHPMLSVGFVGSLFLGGVFLNEDITIKKIIGIMFVLVGVCFLSRQGKDKQDGNGGEEA